MCFWGGVWERLSGGSIRLMKQTSAGACLMSCCWGGLGGGAKPGFIAYVSKAGFDSTTHQLQSLFTGREGGGKVRKRDEK